MTVDEPRALVRLLERNPLAAAVVLSLVIHLGLYGSWHLGKQLGWWKQTPSWLVKLTQKMAAPAKARQPQAVQDRSIPMTFVEVDPATVTAEAPENAKYYSSKNSKAANPDPKNQQAVKVDGKQEQVVRLMENQKPLPFPLQPSAPKPPKPEEPAEPKPKTEAPGDLAFVRPREPKPATAGEVDTGSSQAQPKERPRTLAAARAQNPKLAGQTMKQEGGMSNLGKVAFDTKATPFGDYDLAFISAVERCWYLLLDQHEGTRLTGKVVVDFRLTYDGRITDIKVNEKDAFVTETQAVLCQSAILNPQPYPRWPTPMWREMGGKPREMRFTFYYN